MSRNRLIASLFMISLLLNCFSDCFSFESFHSMRSPKLAYTIRKSNRISPLFAAQTVTPTFQPVTVVNSKQDAAELKLIEVKVTPELVEAYKNPGQYVQIKIDENKPGFYAIASPPDGRDVFTFLVKETENNKWFSAMDSGKKIDMSLPQGKGFQIEEYFNSYRFDFPTTNVYLMATGSGIAPIASAIESNILGLKTTLKNSLGNRKATLYIGARTVDRLPLQSKYAEWESLGVSIIPVLSGSDVNNWKGKRGYIQDALREDTVRVPRNSGALLCGQRGMVESVKDIMMTAGVFEGKILLNF